MKLFKLQKGKMTTQNEQNENNSSISHKRVSSKDLAEVRNKKLCKQ